MRFHMCTLVMALILTPSLRADPEVRKSVERVQSEMQQPGFAKQSANDSPNATKTYKQVEALAGSDANVDAIYALSAEILGNFKDLSPEEMMKALLEAQKNPQGFAAKLTPEQRKRLKELSERMPASNQKQP